MNPNKKSNNPKIIIVLIVFFLLLLIATYVVYSYYVKNNQNEDLKEEFFSKIVNNDFGFFIDNEIYRNIINKRDKESYRSDSNIKMSTTMKNNIFSKLNLEKIEFNFSIVKNMDNNRYSSKLDTQYAGNHFLTLDFLMNPEQFAMKSDEIVNKYVGFNINNTQNLMNQLAEKDVDLSLERKMKNFVIDREYIELNKIANLQSFVKYANQFKKNTESSNFSKKENVIVTLDSQQFYATEYTIELDIMQTNKVLTGLLEELSNDSELLSKLVTSNVKDFENEDTKILEYTDNDNISQIPGEENNFNTSLNTWGENTITQNTTTNEELSTTNAVTNNTVSNNTVSNNTVSNNTVSDTISSTNIIESSNTVQNNTDLNTTVENTISQQEIHEQTTQEQSAETVHVPLPSIENQQQTTNNTTPENVIEEEDNFRTQGFIEVNEQTEDDSSDDEENTFIVGENYQDTVKNIEKLVENIDWSYYLLTGARANCSQEELIEKLQKVFNDKIKENNCLAVKMYVSDDKVIKLTFEFSETPETLDFQIILKSENEKYLNLTVLKGKDNEASGYNVSLYKKKDDAANKTKISINKIHNNKINQKTNIDLDTKGTVSSKKYYTNMSVLYSNSEGEFKLEVDNMLDFDAKPEIEELNNDNCLFMDMLSNEELLLTRDAIKQKTMDVLKDKNKNLNIIEINNSNSVVKQTEQQLPEQEDINAKEQAKQALIQTLSNKMREYLDNGTNLKIEDLEGLEIPGYEVDISIGSNLAIITVNGYKFKLDSDFNLSDS